MLDRSECWGPMGVTPLRTLKPSEQTWEKWSSTGEQRSKTQGRIVWIFRWSFSIPSGKRLHNYGTSPCLMGKSTISMAIFHSYVSHYQRVSFVLIRIKICARSMMLAPAGLKHLTLRSTGWSGAGAFHLSICSTHLRSQWWGCQSGIVKHVPL